MALFAIALALFLVSGEASASIQDHCTDISYYDVVKYETSTKQCCDTKLHLVCTTKSDQVCQDVLELQCEVVAWGECISTPTNTPGTKCGVKFNDFAHQNCKELTASVAETKKVPECKQKTKNNCVTDWEVDSNGNKVWAGTETCTPVTWEECELVEKTVEFPTVKTECHVDSHIKWAEFIDATTNIVGLESKCEVKKAVNCKNVVVNKCAPVVWQECKMEPREECLTKVIHTPSQEKIHHKKCLTGETPGIVLRVSENGTLTTSPLSLGSTATVTCQSTGGQNLTLSKNQEQLGSSQQDQINHTFTVDQDDHGAVFRCVAEDQTRSDPQVAELTLKVHSVDGDWSLWSSWGACSKSCGTGKRERTRICSNPKPAGDGKPCEGDDKETEDCGNDCVHGGWSEWNNWSVCSAPCGPATRTRQRTCTQPEPAKGGELCIGDEEQTQDCDLSDCKVSWTDPVLACIWEGKFEIVNDVTLEECQEKCDSTTAFPCRSVQWSNSGLFAETCWMSNVTSANTTKYQRPCTGIFSNLLFSERIGDSIDVEPFHPFVYWSCEFCSEASFALVSRTTSTSFLQDEAELLVSKLCPSHPDPNSCKSSLPTFWAGYGKAIWSGFWALICLDQDCSSNDRVPEFWYRVANSKTLATCSDCQERIKTHLDRLDGVTALNKYQRKLPKFCEYQRTLPEFLDVEECKELGKWLDPDFAKFLKEEYRQNEDWITDICLDLDCIGPSLRVSENGTLTTSPLSLGSTAKVTCQSTGGQILKLYKNQEPLESSQQQDQISHNFTVDQDDHEAVFRCEARDQTRTDPQVAELTLKVLPCSEWSKWSKCSHTCGRGNQTRNRCAVEQQWQWCNIEDCPPGNCSEWQWTNWTSCSVTCGNGIQIRQREVDTFHKFKRCEVERIQLTGCNIEDCHRRCDGEKDCCKESNPCGLDDGDCDKDCCNPSNPCGLDDGVCDEDRDCKPGLICEECSKNSTNNFCIRHPGANVCTRPKGRCEGIFCLHENRRCPEGRGASGKTTTYNWYDDKWPARGQTAESCKALCQQDPTCPQADFYDRGDCYVYTNSTGPGVNVGGCAIVGCVPKEMYFKCEDEQGHCSGIVCLPEEKRSAVTNTPTEDQDLYKLVRKEIEETTALPNEGKPQPVDSAIELNIIPYFFKNKIPDKDKDVYREKMKEIEKQTNKCFIFQEEKVLAKCNTMRCLEIETKSEPEIKSKSEKGFLKTDSLCCRGFVAKTKNVVERVILISYTRNCNLTSPQCQAFILHELMHVIGVGHTFTRSDRDENINVLENNVNKLGLSTFFTKCKEHCLLESDINYDCESIMHYGTHANGEQLMEPIKEPCVDKLKKEPTVKTSSWDRKLLKKMCDFEGSWSAVPCPTGWMKKPTGCYKFVESSDAMTGAANCKSQGGYLAEINSQEEQNEVWQMYESLGEKLDAIWIGGSDEAKEGTWLDHSGTKLKYTNWKEPNEPNGPNGGTRKNCIAFEISLDGKWIDAPCNRQSSSMKSLCEYDRIPAGIIQSVRALGGLTKRMSFELNNIYGPIESMELTKNEESLIEQMEETTTYLTESCRTQNSCKSEKISKFPEDLHSRYDKIRQDDKISRNFLQTFIEKKAKLQESIFASENFLILEQKPFKAPACTNTCEKKDEICVKDKCMEKYCLEDGDGEKCLKKCPVTDLEEKLETVGKYSFIEDDCYCPARGGGLCPKQLEDTNGCGGNICEINYGCMLNVCPYISGIPWPLLLG